LREMCEKARSGSSKRKVHGRGKKRRDLVTQKGVLGRKRQQRACRKQVRKSLKREVLQKDRQRPYPGRKWQREFSGHERSLGLVTPNTVGVPATEGDR